MIIVDFSINKAAVIFFYDSSLFYIVSIVYSRKLWKNFVCFKKSCTFASRLLSNRDKIKILSTLFFFVRDEWSVRKLFFSS